MDNRISKLLNNTGKFITFLLVLSAITSCKKEKKASFKFEADPPGKWFKGDFHVHATGASNDTGGDSWPEAIKTKALERGLDFVVLTDHSNSTGSDATTTEEDPALFNLGPEFPYWQKSKELTEAGKFLMICGNELSPVQEESLKKPVGHIACIPKDIENFDTESPFIDRPKGAVNGAETLQQALDRGCFTIVNHPYSLQPWIKYDWTGTDYDAIEIWNGTIGYDFSDDYARRAWICDLLAGKNTVAIGGSDCHRVHTQSPGVRFDSAIGFPATAVFAEKLEWPLIIESLQNGITYVSEGNSKLLLDVYFEDGKRAQNSNFDIIRLRGQADENLDAAELQLLHTTNCLDSRPDTEAPELTDSILLKMDIKAAENFDLRFSTKPAKGVYHAKLTGSGGHYYAFSRAITVN